MTFTLLKQILTCSPTHFSSSVATFLVWGGGGRGGGEAKILKCTDGKYVHIGLHVIYMRERAKRASAWEIYLQVSEYLSNIYTQCSSILLLIAVKTTVYRQNSNFEQIYCMRENLYIFTFLNCYFFQYFVDTSDTLSVQMTCLSRLTCLYLQISKCTDKTPKTHYGNNSPPPPPPWLR